MVMSRCADCHISLDEEDANVEAFEATGNLLCPDCWDALCEMDDPGEHSTYHVRNGSVVG
jgi:hypothetical protein